MDLIILDQGINCCFKSCAVDNLDSTVPVTDLKSLLMEVSNITDNKVIIRCCYIP